LLEKTLGELILVIMGIELGTQVDVALGADSANAGCVSPLSSPGTSPCVANTSTLYLESSE
jgi:hypothetical protein